MKTIRHLLPLLAICTVLAAPCSLLHAEAPGKTQQLTSPDQVPEGLAKSDWASIRAAYEAGRHAFQPIEGGWQARNPGQQWTTKFDRRGFLAQPRDGDWQWGLELKAYGFPGIERTISGVPAVKAEGQRLSYLWDATVQEWWVNDQRGLEHGFTIKERPPCAASSPSLIVSQSHSLSFTLAVRGTLTPHITADALGVEFHDAAGATVLNYTGLKVWDADGKVLPSRFVAVPEGVHLLVEEEGARYPLTIDPIAQQAYLKASQVTAIDAFGGSVAVSGDTVVVGANQEDGSATGVNGTVNEAANNAGAAYVFVRSGTTWSQQAYLKASQVSAVDRFGWSVAASGDTVVVGAHQEDGSSTGVNGPVNEAATTAGAAYVFVRNGTTWSQQAYLKASQVTAFDQFGYSVAVMGDTVVVGAPTEDGSATGVNGPVDESANNAGAAYVFVRSGTTWSQQAYLKASQVTAVDNFGNSVAVSGDTVVVGAYQEDGSASGVNGTPDESAFNAGAACVFVRNGTTWSQQTYLKASQVTANDIFGYSVAVAGDTVVVGAPLESGSSSGVNGPVNELALSAGAAYVFVRSGTTWSQQAYLKASQVSVTDQFGHSLAISGDTVVVGAIDEDGTATGVNGPVSEFASDSGAAYVFVRSGMTWSQQAYLKASQVTDGDEFGTAVAVSGDTVVVGAWSEDGGATGVNGPANELASSSGAAYIFTGLGPAQSVYAAWAIANGVSTDPAANGGANLLAFAFGYPPGGATGALVYTGTFAGSGAITATGQPITRMEGADIRAVFVRRKDHVTAGLTYSVEFSATLGVWEDSVAIPTVLADDGVNQIVSVPYPALVAGLPPQFFRLRMGITP